jgi:hypothetical protein
MYSTWTVAHLIRLIAVLFFPLFFFFWINLVDDRTNGRKPKNKRERPFFSRNHGHELLVDWNTKSFLNENDLMAPIFQL